MMKHHICIFFVVAGINMMVSANGAIGKDTTGDNPAVQVQDSGKTIIRPTRGHRGKPDGLQETSGKSSEIAVGESIRLQVISMGSAVGISDYYRLGGTAGQMAAGSGNSEHYGIGQGFWSNVSSGCCIDLTGNVDGDLEDVCDIGDLTALIDYLFITLTAPECLEEANIDGSTDDVIDVGDMTALIDYLFINFRQPAECL